jgi:hypothetical protein
VTALTGAGEPAVYDRDVERYFGPATIIQDGHAHKVEVEYDTVADPPGPGVWAGTYFTAAPQSGPATLHATLRLPDNQGEGHIHITDIRCTSEGLDQRGWFTGIGPPPC